jgi:hypothetical protein
MVGINHLKAPGTMRTALGQALGMNHMRLPSPPRIVIVSREDREAKLKTFILEALAARSGTPLEAFGEAITLVARAPDSPVAQALLAITPEITAANIAIRVVLFETEPLSEEHVQSSLLDVGAIEVRMLSDQRFAAAHEQLSLGGGRVWIGDCMRRDPAKRDAFEMFHADNAATAGHAAASFAKMWDKSIPLRRVVSASVAANAMLASQAPAAGSAISRR